MGKKSLLSLAGIVLAGTAISGCQTSRPGSGGPMMSGATPSMMGAANQANANATGLAQNQQGQAQNWNNRMAGSTVNGTVPASGTSYPGTTGMQSHNASRMGAPDRSFQTPNTAGGTTSFSRQGTSPASTTGVTPGYQRTSTTSNSDRMLTSPTAPVYPATSSGSTTQGSSISSGMTKPATPSSTLPAPAPVSATSPQFGTTSGLTSPSTAPSFNPPSGTSTAPVPATLPGTDGNQ